MQMCHHHKEDPYDESAWFILSTTGYIISCITIIVNEHRYSQSKSYAELRC